MPCNYFANNGKPSLLYDRLFSYYKDVEKMNNKQAELAAVTSWLSTRTKAYVDFAGHTEDDTVQPNTKVLDANGEPELVYMGRSTRINDMKQNTSDYGIGWEFTPESNSKYAAFLSIKNPKLVEITDQTTDKEYSDATYALRSNEYDGVIFTYTKEDGTIEKQYVVKEVEQIQTVYLGKEKGINTSFNQWDDPILLDEVRKDQERTQPVANFILPADDTFRVLATVVNSSDTNDIPKIARGVLIKAAKKIPIEQVSGSSIVYKNGIIEVGTDLNVTRERFDNLITSESLKAYLSQVFEEGQLTVFDNVFAAAPVLFRSANISAAYTESKEAFMNAFFSDRSFFQLTADTRFPGTKETIQEILLKEIAQTFDLRTSYLPMLAAMMERNQVIRQRAGKVLYQLDLGEAPTEDTTPADTSKIVSEVKSSAPFSHLMTGDKLMDKRIAATFEKIQSLRGRLNRKGKPAEITRIRADINKYQKELDEMVEHRSAEMLINVGQRDMMRMKTALDRQIQHNEVWENLNLLESWIDFSTYFDPAEVDSVLMSSIRDISINAMELYDKYTKLYWDSITSSLAEEGVPIQYLSQITPEAVIEDIGALASSFIGLSFGGHGLEVAADIVIRRAAMNINTGLIDFQERLREKIDKLPSKDISFMFQPDKDGKLYPITTYKRELYEKTLELNNEARESEKDRRPLYQQQRELVNQYREAVAAKDKFEMLRLNNEIEAIKKQIADHKAKTKGYESVNEFMRNNFTYKLTEEGKKEFQEFAEIMKEGYYDYNPETNQMEFAELRYSYELKQHDPENLLAWLKDPKSEHPRFASKYFAIRPKDEWKNDAFHKFSPAQKEFYDFFVKEYLAAQANVPMDYSFTEYNSDKLLREFSYMKAEPLSKFKYVSKEIKEFVADIATVKYFDKEISYDRTAPFSKRQIKKLKYKKVSDFSKGTDGYFKEGEELPTSLKEGLAAGRYKYKDGYLVVSSKGSQNEKMVKKIITKSDDPLEIFNNYIKFSLSYRYKNEVQDTLNGIRELAYAIPKESEQNRGITNPLGLRFGAKNGSNFEKRLDYTIDAFITENLKDAPEMTMKGKPGERVFSLGQLADSVNSLTRVRQLGLNPVSGLSNLSMGTASNFMYASRQEFFNESDLRKGYWLIKDSIASFYSGGMAKSGNARKIMLIMQQFNMLGNLQEKFYMDKEWVEKAFEHMYIFQKGGEYLNQGAVVLAMMNREKVKLKDGKTVNLWDAYEVKEGKLVFKYPDADYADAQKLFVFTEAAKKVNKEIHGDYDILNPIGAKRKVYGRVGMLFRTWMPQAIKQRLGGEYTDYQLSMLKGETVNREGRWRTAGRFFGGFDKGTSVYDPMRSGENILKFIGAIAASTLSNTLGRKIVNDSRLNATDQANMYANVKEAWWLTMLAVATAVMIRSFKSDDEDDENPIEQSWFKYLYNQTSRVESELWFFYDPISALKIFRDAVPMWSTFKQASRVWDSSKNFVFDNESDTYKRGFRKGDSKFATQLELFFPLSKQAQSIWSMTSEFYSDNYY